MKSKFVLILILLVAAMLGVKNGMHNVLKLE